MGCKMEFQSFSIALALTFEKCHDKLNVGGRKWRDRLHNDGAKAAIFGL